MKSILLTFDIEEFDVPPSYGIKESMEEQCKISAYGLTHILNLLKKHNAKATFFLTLQFAKHQPELVKEIVKQGHEIALHAHTHNHNYTTMNQDKALKLLKEAKDYIEKKFKVKIFGFRGPQMKRPSYKILKELNIKYDSSSHPTYMLAKFNQLFDSRKITNKEGIIEVPLTVTPIARFSITWIFFRNFPLFYTKFCTLLALLDSDYINIYLHPWDFVNINLPKYKKLFVFIRRNSGENALKKLDNYILWLKPKDLKFETINEYLKIN